MAGLSKVENYLMELGLSYQEATPNTFYVEDEARGLPGVAITVEEPVVFFRTKVMSLPKIKNIALYETLLTLNAEDILHGAYGIDGQDVVLVDTLEYETMDRSEFEAALDSIGLALSKHYAVLGAYRD
ncbi:MAG TPA: YbjN domain-containing protein [Spirochaetales bacterium]|nr:YbjN domain-containing protein [Spirochaetales bacterium]